MESCQKRILAFNVGYAEVLFGGESCLEKLIQHVNLFIQICAVDVTADFDFR